MLMQHCQIPEELLHMWGNLTLVQYMWSNEKLDDKNKEHHTTEHLSASPLINFKRPFWRQFFQFSTEVSWQLHHTKMVPVQFPTKLAQSVPFGIR